MSAAIAVPSAIVFGALVTYGIHTSRSRQCATEEDLAKIMIRLEGVDARLKRIENWVFKPRA